MAAAPARGDLVNRQPAPTLMDGLDPDRLAKSQPVELMKVLFRAHRRHGALDDGGSPYEGMG